MSEPIKGLSEPPIQGKVYNVPCVYATNNVSIIGFAFDRDAPEELKPTFDPVSRLPTGPYFWWPVYLPSHEDTLYADPKIDLVPEWDDFMGRDVEKKVYRGIPGAVHHYHIDSRFLNDEMLKTRGFVPYVYERYNHGSGAMRGTGFVGRQRNEPELKLELREMLCLNPTTPDIKPFLGERFIQDYKGSIAKCRKCPHKGLDLNQINPVKGVLTCPMHGLKFDNKTLECLTVGLTRYNAPSK